MKSIILFLGVLVTVRAAPNEPKDEPLRGFSFDDIMNNRFAQRIYNGTWLTGNELFFRIGNGDYVKFNVENQTENIILRNSMLTQWPGASVEFIRPDFTMVLVRYSTTEVLRHPKAKYALLDTTTGNFSDIANGEQLRTCIVSPNGQTLVYVKDNNIYYRPNLLENVEIPLTDDGIPGVIFNGVADWMYYFIFYPPPQNTLWYSNDGTQLAMARFDDANVTEFSYHLYGTPGDPTFQYPKEQTYRYAKVNTTNPSVSVRVMNLTANTLSWGEIPAPVNIVGEDHVLGAVNWIGQDLGVLWTNRRQNVATFQRCDVRTLQCVEFVGVNETNGWYELYTPRCTSAGDRCFFLGNNHGWRRIWELDGETITYKSPENFTVIEINGYDEVNNDLYYTAAPASAPQNQYVYRNAVCLTCDLLQDDLSGNRSCSIASASFSTDYSYFAVSCVGPTPWYTQIFRTNDSQIALNWERNENLRDMLAAYQQPTIQFLRVPVSGGFKASVKLYLPPEIDFEDFQNSTDKYPMIVLAYGGPASVSVVDMFSIGFETYLTTTKKTIYCRIDGRGTGNQGYEFMFTLNNQLGTFEAEDQLTVTQYLQEKYTFIDRERTGIWGWSYGGYVSSLTLEKDHESVFKCGISVAPVTSWMFYQSIYAEHYMGLLADNQEGYNRSDVTLHVDGLRNHTFLLIHGNADDNVHFQNAMVLVRALVDEDIQFEQISYPDETHDLHGVQRHLYHAMDNFWDRCFMQNYTSEKFGSV